MKVYVPRLQAVLIIITLFTGCASHSQTRRPERVVNTEAAQEMAIGEQIHNAILSSFYPYTEPKLVGYVNKIGTSLAAYSERRELSYRFTVLYSDKIYATSAPGGFVYVTTGMLYFLENEAELAGILAHEIGELQNRELQNKRASQVLDAVTRGGAMVGSAFGPIGILAAVGLVALNHAAQPGEIHPDKKFIEADKRALHYMLQSGHDPQGLIDILHKFVNAKPEIIPYFYDYYQSRPISEDRFLAINQAFSELPLSGKSFDTRRDIYQDMTKGVREIYKQ